MLGAFVTPNIVVGAVVYFYFYQLWPHKWVASRTIRIRSDRHFVLVYRYIQVSTPIYACLSAVDGHPPCGLAVAWFGIWLAVASILLFMWSMVSLRGRYCHCFDAYVPDSLAERGPYRFVRHPIYVANCTGLWGMFLATASWGVLFNCVILAIYYWRAARREEASLVQHLPGYTAYLHRTGKFFPRIAHPMRSWRRGETR